MTQAHPTPAAADASFAAPLLGATFLLGSSFIAGKILLQGGFPPMVLVGWRFVVAAFATLPLVYLDNRRMLAALLPASIGCRGAVLVGVIGLMQTAAVMGLLFLAMQFISAATAAILLFTNPIWVALLGRFFLGEALHGARVAGLVLGVVGVALAIGVGPEVLAGGTVLRGEGLGLLSALCWSGATIVNKRANLAMSPWALNFWQMLVGALAILAIAYGTGQGWPAVTTPMQWGWFLWLAIPASTGSFGLWFVALARGGATRASGYLFLAPLFTVILSFFILGSALSWLQAAGGLLIGVALWLVNREKPAGGPASRREEVMTEGDP